MPDQNTFQERWTKRIKSSLTTNKIVSVSAVLISVCALIVSISEVSMLRTQQKAMVYPHLDLSTNYSSDGFSITIKNSGMGIALINTYRLYNDRRDFNRWDAIADFYLPEGHDVGYNIITTNGIQDKVITPNEEVILFRIPWTDETRILVDSLIATLEYDICYCSMLQDCWEITSATTRPVASDCKK